MFDSIETLADALITATNSGATADALSRALVLTDLDRRSETEGTVELGIPVDVLNALGGCSLLSAIAGYFSTYAGVLQFGVERLEIPARGCEVLGFVGPTGRHTDATDIRIGVILKPRFAASGPELEFLEWCGQSGFDYVVQDELSIGNTIDDVVAMCDAASRALTTSRECEFIVNLTMRPLAAFEAAVTVSALPRVGVMVNLITMAVDTVHEIRSIAPAVTIFGNIIARGMVSGSRDFYISEDTVAYLARLSGADVVYIGPFVGEIRTRIERSVRIRLALANSVCGGAPIAPSSAGMSGGVDLVGIWQNAKAYDGPMTCLLGRAARSWYDAGIPASTMQRVLSVAKAEEQAETLFEFREAVERAVGTDARGQDASGVLSALGIRVST